MRVKVWASGFWFTYRRAATSKFRSEPPTDVPEKNSQIYAGRPFQVYKKFQAFFWIKTDFDFSKKIKDIKNKSETITLNTIIGLRSSDKHYWSIRTYHGREEPDPIPSWVAADRKLIDQGLKTKRFCFMPRIYPEVRTDLMFISYVWCWIFI